MNISQHSFPDKVHTPLVKEFEDYFNCEYLLLIVKGVLIILVVLYLKFGKICLALQILNSPHGLKKLQREYLMLNAVS